MKCLDLSLTSPAENLACDEALLDLCEEEQGIEVLRFWESPSLFAVAGYANKVATEINLAGCEQAGVAVLRRCSGGGAVLQGPGCLNFSLILRIEERVETGTVAGANEFIMEAQREALQTLCPSRIEIRGCTDLAADGIKFSGNAQRRRRRCLLFHGCVLLDFDLSQMDLLLRMPSREPDYRRGRSHAEFVANFPANADEVKTAIRSRWHAEEPLAEFPRARMEQLVRERYGRPEWNMKF